MAKDARKLKDIATKAVDKGKYEKALDAYLALEQLEPGDGSWSRRAADMYRRLKRNPEAVVALERAADRYAKVGFLVKAVAVCKMILQIDPEHSATQARLAELQDSRGIPAARKPAPAPAEPQPEPVPAPPAEPAAVTEAIDDLAIELDGGEAGELEIVPTQIAAAPRRRTLPPGAPLEQVSLRDVVPGSQPAVHADGSTSSDMIEIPLELDDLEEIEVDAGDLAGAVDAAEAEASLRGTPLFSALGPDALRSFINKVVLVELDAGETLFRQGDSGQTLYVVAEGEVAVVNEGPPRVQLSRLGEGSFCGEIALVTEQPRSATIEATVATELLAIDRDVIGDLVEDEPEVLQVLLRFLRDRLLNSLIATSPLFAPFAGEEREMLASRFKFLEAEPGAVLITQGHRAEGLFVMLSGQAEVVMATPDGERRRLATLASGDLSGEMSLLSNGPAVATVRTTSKAFLLELPGDDFRQVIMTHPQVLMFVGDLAEERRRRYEAILAGDAEYETSHLDLV